MSEVICYLSMGILNTAHSLECCLAGMLWFEPSHNVCWHYYIAGMCCVLCVAA